MVTRTIPVCPGSLWDFPDKAETTAAFLVAADFRAAATEVAEEDAAPAVGVLAVVAEVDRAARVAAEDAAARDKMVCRGD